MGGGRELKLDVRESDTSVALTRMGNRPVAVRFKGTRGVSGVSLDSSAKGSESIRSFWEYCLNTFLT